MIELLKRIKRYLFCICDLEQISVRYIEIENHRRYEADALYETIYRCRKCRRVSSRFVEVEKRRYSGGRVKDYICQE